MNLSNQKSRFLFATHPALVTVFAVILFGLITMPANAATQWHIKDDATGGDCSLIGSWDTASKTCTLSQDLDRGVVIDNDGITFDGNNNTIASNVVASGYGIYIESKNLVTIKNTTIEKFAYGIFFSSHYTDTSDRHTIINNVLINNLLGIYLRSSQNIIKGNSISGGGINIENNSSQNIIEDNEILHAVVGIGVSAGGAGNKIIGNKIFGDGSDVSSEGIGIRDGNGIGHYVIVRNNDVSNHRYGLRFTGANTSGNEVRGNTFHNNGTGLVLAHQAITQNSIVSENVIDRNHFGIVHTPFCDFEANNVIRNNTISNSHAADGFAGVGYIGGCGINKIYNNNFLYNGIQARTYLQEVFNLGAPIGGNYWSDCDELKIRCPDSNDDGFWDAPYTFSGGQDNLPWTKKDGWLAPSKILYRQENESGERSARGVCQPLGKGLSGVMSGFSIKARFEQSDSSFYPASVDIGRNGFNVYEGESDEGFRCFGGANPPTFIATTHGRPGSIVGYDPFNTVSFQTLTYSLDNPFAFDPNKYYALNFILQDAAQRFTIKTSSAMDAWTNVAANAGYVTPFTPWEGDENNKDIWFRIEKAEGNAPPTLSFLETSPDGVSENDGIQDKKGTADKTLFGFHVIYTDSDNNAPSSVRLVVEKVNDGGYESYLNLEMSRLDPREHYAGGQLYVVVVDDLVKSLTFPKGNYRYRFKASDGVVDVQTSFTEFTVGYSNVAFLPGIKGSRLYKSYPCVLGTCEDQLWEPTLAGGDVAELFLDPNGNTMSNEIYTKSVTRDGVIDEINDLIVPINVNVYESFLSDLEKWKNIDDTIRDYRVLPYDWRLAIDDILNNGNHVGGKIYYSGDNASTSNPFILQQLEQLVSTSDSGKVTIIAHSNGGLVTKQLLKNLENKNDPLLNHPLLKKIDNVVLVAVPQLGTPQAVGALLHGYDQGLPFNWLPILLTPKTARTLASTSPMAYHLLPSPSYYHSAGGTISTPIITFDDSTLTQSFIDKYGHSVTDASEMQDFLLGKEGRSEPDPSDIYSPSVLKESFLTYGENLHKDLDLWEPPQSISLYQIAGWGEETLSSIRYWTGTECTEWRWFGTVPLCFEFSPKLFYTPVPVIDGDGTVVVPSALAISESASNASRWWVNLKEYDTYGNYERTHGDIFEVPELRNFIRDQIITTSTQILPDYISDSVPTTVSTRRLDYYLHSPLSLSASDSNGNEISASTSTIPGARYKRYGEVQHISVPADIAPTIELYGYADGSFTLEIQEMLGNEIIATTTFSGIPSSTSTIVTMGFPQGTIAEASPLMIDANGDGTTDFSMMPKLGSVVTPDVVPPEAVLYFDVDLQDVVIKGVDKGGTTIVETIATSTTIRDEGGNALTIPFIKHKEKATKLRVVFDTLIYNGVVMSVPKTTVEYDWKITGNGEVKVLNQDVRIKDTRRVSADYNNNKNETHIVDKEREEGEMSIVEETRSGVSVLTFSTNAGNIEVVY